MTQSTTNSQSWLNANGWGEGGMGEPNGGYGPINQPQPPNPATALTDSNMPPGLAAVALAHGDRIFMMEPDEGPPWMLGDEHGAQFYATTDEDGAINIYGWIDATDWSGSMHMPLNGFMVIPEPVTVALLGLGGLALLRRRRRA